MLLLEPPAQQSACNGIGIARLEFGWRGRMFCIPSAQENGMSIAELVYEQVKALPEPLAREVLDFVGYLRERRERSDWRDLMLAQSLPIAHIWDNPEDAVWDDA